MRKDILTTIIAAIAGIAVSFLVTSNLIIKDPATVTVNAPQSVIDTNLDEPNPEVFNYRAINPTVEAYVDCVNYDYAGNCMGTTEDTSIIEEIDVTDDTTEENNAGSDTIEEDVEEDLEEEVEE